MSVSTKLNAAGSEDREFETTFPVHLSSGASFNPYVPLKTRTDETIEMYKGMMEAAKMSALDFVRSLIILRDRFGDENTKDISWDHMSSDYYNLAAEYLHADNLREKPISEVCVAVCTAMQSEASEPPTPADKQTPDKEDETLEHKSSSQGSHSPAPESQPAVTEGAKHRVIYSRPAVKDNQDTIPPPRDGPFQAWEHEPPIIKPGTPAYYRSQLNHLTSLISSEQLEFEKRMESAREAHDKKIEDAILYAEKNNISDERLHQKLDAMNKEFSRAMEEYEERHRMKMIDLQQQLHTIDIRKDAATREQEEFERKKLSRQEEDEDPFAGFDKGNNPNEYTTKIYNSFREYRKLTDGRPPYKSEPEDLWYDDEENDDGDQERPVYVGDQERKAKSYRKDKRDSQKGQVSNDQGDLDELRPRTRERPTDLSSLLEDLDSKYGSTKAPPSYETATAITVSEGGNWKTCLFNMKPSDMLTDIKKVAAEYKKDLYEKSNRNNDKIIRLATHFPRITADYNKVMDEKRRCKDPAQLNADGELYQKVEQVKDTINDVLAICMNLQSGDIRSTQKVVDSYFTKYSRNLTMMLAVQKCMEEFLKVWTIDKDGKIINGKKESYNFKDKSHAVVVSDQVKCFLEQGESYDALTREFLVDARNWHLGCSHAIVPGYTFIVGYDLMPSWASEFASRLLGRCPVSGQEVTDMISRIKQMNTEKASESPVKAIAQAREMRRREKGAQKTLEEYAKNQKSTTFNQIRGNKIQEIFQEAGSRADLLPPSSASRPMITSKGSRRDRRNAGMLPLKYGSDEEEA